MRNPFIPSRDHRFDHCSDAIDFIERTNCAKGCTMPRGNRDIGPGGDCYILAMVGMGDGKPIHELDDHGRYITCLIRTPPPRVEPEKVDLGPDLFEATS